VRNVTILYVKIISLASEYFPEICKSDLLNLIILMGKKFDMIPKPTIAHNCLKVYYTFICCCWFRCRI
jgi:hypothetical protein